MCSRIALLMHESIKMIIIVTSRSLLRVAEKASEANNNGLNKNYFPDISPNFTENTKKQH